MQCLRKHSKEGMYTCLYVRIHTHSHICIAESLCCIPETNTHFKSTHFRVVQLLSHVRLLLNPRTAAHQASLSITNSWSLFKLMSVKSVMPPSSVIPFFSRLQFFPASESFPVSQFFASGGQSTGASASASVLPMNIQD